MNIGNIVTGLMIISIIMIMTNGASATEIELKYDDGIKDGGWSIGGWTSPDPFSSAFDGGSKGQAVRFSPGSTFTINSIKVYGKKYGTDTNMRIEIWDKDKKVIYKDISKHLDHFKTSWSWSYINIPSIKVSGDFYVVLFTGSMDSSLNPTTGVWIGSDITSPTGRSYVVDNYNVLTWNPQIPSTNWMIRTVGLGSIQQDISVTSPNGGENWIRGKANTILWSYTGDPGKNVKIELLKAGIFNKLISSNTLNDGYYSWLVPSDQTIGNDYKIKITSTTNSAYTDVSNNNFIINSGFITVVSPNGGEDWKQGKTHNIIWKKSGTTGPNVKIELLKAGIVNKVISWSTDNDGSYSWTIPSKQTTGSNYKIRIVSTGNPIYKDTSNNDFKISSW